MQQASTIDLWRGKLVDQWRARVVQSFATFGGMLVMTIRAVRHITTDIPTGRFPWREFFRQSWFIISVSVLPTLLVAIPIGVVVSVQVGSLAAQVGATSFTGAANGLGIVRQGAPLVVALMLAGAVGSAICADLGARTIREEIDALETMGISPVRRLVAPRLLATLFVSVLLCGLVAFVGVVVGYAFNIIVIGGTPGSYIDSFASFAQPADLILALVKSLIFGGIVAAVGCYKGLSASGGPKGVANAVNAAVVLAVILLFVVNVVITQVDTVLFPQRIV